jgi:hypothetical protein
MVVFIFHGAMVLCVLWMFHAILNTRTGNPFVQVPFLEYVVHIFEINRNWHKLIENLKAPSNREKTEDVLKIRIHEVSKCVTRANCRVPGLALLIRVGTLWRCGDGLFFEVPPLASDALLTTLHPLLENVLQTVCRKLQEDSGTGGFDILVWLEKPRNRMGRDLDCMACALMGMMAVPIRTSAPCEIWTVWRMF